jgi:hypothetical protein
MPTTYATEVASIDNIPSGAANGGVHGGRLRRFRATITLAAQANGDDIVLARVPAGYAFSHGVINASATLGASATVAIGVAGSTGKYRTAAVFTAAAPTLFGNVAAVAEAPLTAQTDVLLTIAVAALPGSGTCTVDLFFSAP